MKVSPPTADTVQTKEPVLPTIADYQLLSAIGRGAYGEVWLARSLTGSFVALKIVRRAAFDHDRPFEREFEGIKRFEPISRSDPSQVTILHVGRGEGFFYYVMELADDANVAADVRRLISSKSAICNSKSAMESEPPHVGCYVPRTLKHDIRTRGALPVAECVQIALSLTHALAHLHKHGLVHRDVKPSNVIFVNGVAKLADIGLVTGVDATRSFVGTEGYFPPEGAGTPSADCYSLGKLLYELSTGHDRTAWPEPPADLATRPDRESLLELNAILHRVCAPDPRERYQAAAEMCSELGALQRGQSIKRKRAWEERWKVGKRLGFAAALLALVVLGAIFALHELNRARSSNREALNFYNTALTQLERNPQRQTREAYTNLVEALKRDPKFIDAWYQLFEIYADSWGESLPRFFDQAANQRWVATNLWKLDRNSAQYHTVNAWLSFGQWQFDEAISEARRAIQLDPSFLRAHVEYAHFMLLLRGDVDTARKHYEIAASLRGSDLANPSGLVSSLYYERKFSEVIELLKRAQKIDPHTPGPHDMLSRAYEAVKDYGKAIDEYEEYDKLSSDDPAKIEANCRKQRAALKEHGPRGWWQTKLDQMRQGPSPDPYEMAKLYARLDDKEEAFKLLEKAYGEHNGSMVWVLFDDVWDSARQDPHFKDIVKKMGLGPK